MRLRINENVIKAGRQHGAILSGSPLLPSDLTHGRIDAEYLVEYVPSPMHFSVVKGDPKTSGLRQQLVKES